MNKSTSGFTIVELLVVIVVIAILAAISVVAYNGVTVRAENGLLESKVTTFQKSLENFYTLNDRYPGSWEMRGTAAAAILDLKPSDLTMPGQGSQGIYCWDINADLTLKNICYVAHPNVDGSGFMCDPPTICRHYKIDYVDRMTKQKVSIRKGR